MMTDEMTDAEVADQIARGDRFAADFREIAATVVDPASPCADAHRRGLSRTQLCRSGKLDRTL
jgi:hypothetical protein